jgi:diguanylate cyclase (GGDEF)-like protein
MRETLRAEDVIGRWGGEEFLAILPDTDTDDAVALGTRLCEAVAALPIALPDGSQTNVTISIGIFAGDSETVDERISLADHALYQAKRRGRNRVEHQLPEFRATPVAAGPGQTAP